MKGILGLIAVVVVVYAARAGFRHIMNSVATDKGSTCLEMLNNTTSEDEGATYIIGSIKNNCDSSFGQVTILFKVDRAPGPQGEMPEGMAQAYTRDLKGGEIREFKTAQPISKDSSFRFDGINAF